jgi:hypothetical protein
LSPEAQENALRPLWPARAFKVSGTEQNMPLALSFSASVRIMHPAGRSACVMAREAKMPTFEGKNRFEEKTKKRERSECSAGGEKGSNSATKIKRAR